MNNLLEITTNQTTHYANNSCVSRITTKTLHDSFEGQTTHYANNSFVSRITIKTLHDSFEGLEFATLGLRLKKGR